MGSRLIRRDLRSRVHAFYAFARAADDVADDPDLPAAEKLVRLDAFEAGLDGDAAGAPEARALAAAVDPALTHHARHLLRAFRQDAAGMHYARWDDLLAYCENSAAPVGRFLLDLHGEPRSLWPASDALCSALQVLNHLQDLKQDRQRLDRVYLPAEWFKAEGTSPEALCAPRLDPPLRRVLDRTLDRCDAMIAQAAALPQGIRSNRLAGEAGAILLLARRLSRRLRRGDPLARRIKLSPADAAAAAAAGLREALRPGRLLAPAGRETPA